MSRRTKKVGAAGRYGPRYGVRTRRRLLEVEADQRKRHPCPRCRAVAVKRTSVGVWTCRRCGLRFAGGAYRPTVTVEAAVASGTDEAEEPEETS